MQLDHPPAPSSAAAESAAPIDPAVAHLRRGRQELGAGRLDTAEKEFRAALAADPKNALAHRELADISVEEVNSTKQSRKCRRLWPCAIRLLGALCWRASTWSKRSRNWPARKWQRQSNLRPNYTEAAGSCWNTWKRASPREVRDERSWSVVSQSRKILASATFAWHCLSLASDYCVPQLRGANSPLVLELKLDREVEPVLATYIDEGLAEATKRQASLVLITMDTPGGLSDSMTDMIHHILDSPGPCRGVCFSRRRAWRFRGFLYSFVR